jgi:hypothetical protein
MTGRHKFSQRHLQHLLCRPWFKPRCEPRSDPPGRDGLRRLRQTSIIVTPGRWIQNVAMPQ